MTIVQYVALVMAVNVGLLGVACFVVKPRTKPIPSYEGSWYQERNCTVQAMRFDSSNGDAIQSFCPLAHRMTNSQVIFLIPTFGTKEDVLHVGEWLVRRSYGWNVYDHSTFQNIFRPMDSDRQNHNAEYKQR